MNPYYIEDCENGAVISFSGGRSSAYMLHQILKAHDYNLPDYVKVIFANTGKEMPQTLDFVRDVSKSWDVDIIWLEYSGKKQFKQVCYETASREGEPFAQLIEDKNYLPNMMARFCTSELKVLTIERFMKTADYLHIVGIRGDEPRRAVKIKTRENHYVPLYEAKVSEDDVSKFWQSQEFDLAMPPAGVNTLSNCDLCFLKGYSIKQSIVEHDPSIADWWVAQEEKINSRFRFDQPSYEKMQIIASDQGQLFEFDDQSIPCFCGD